MAKTAAAPAAAEAGGEAAPAKKGKKKLIIIIAAVVVLLGVATLLLRDTLPPERRRRLQPGPVLRTYGSLLRDRTFVGLVLISGLMFATLFSYIGGSSFVLQEIYGLSVAQFGLAFGLNSLGFLTGSQLNPFLLRRFGPRDIVRAGVTVTRVSPVPAAAATSISAAFRHVLRGTLSRSIPGCARGQ